MAGGGDVDVEPSGVDVVLVDVVGNVEVELVVDVVVVVGGGALVSSARGAWLANPGAHDQPSTLSTGSGPPAAPTGLNAHEPPRGARQ